VDLKARCDAIEECYEFMLAYAAQGVVAESGSESAGQLRALMQRGEQPSISSQLIENLNASIHLRALLTDLFLLDEILGEHARATHSS
jgi:hypothetical protein